MAHKLQQPQTLSNYKEMFLYRIDSRACFPGRDSRVRHMRVGFGEAGATHPPEARAFGEFRLARLRAESVRRFERLPVEHEATPVDDDPPELTALATLSACPQLSQPRLQSVAMSPATAWPAIGMSPSAYRNNGTAQHSCPGAMDMAASNIARIRLWVELSFMLSIDG